MTLFDLTFDSPKKFSSKLNQLIKFLIKMSTLQAPVRVSALIKFSRWSLLGAGVVYGAFHQSRLTKKEAAIREIETKQKAIRDEKLAKEKKIAVDREIAELEALAK